MRSYQQNDNLAFTELGVAMLSSVLASERAVHMNILIMRAFVRLRELLATHKGLAARIDKVEAAQHEHASIITILAQEIKKLKRLPRVTRPKRAFGFQAK